MELTFYTNKAAVFFEMKQYQDAIDLCDRAIQISQEGYYDYKKLAKAYARKGASLAKLKQYDEALAIYDKALVEHNDFAFKLAQKDIRKLKKKQEDEAYINPEIAEEVKQEGVDLFKKGDFPGAIEKFTEAIRRNPTSAALYSNRCSAYTKVMDLGNALKDAEKGLELDPNFVKLYIRKGNVHNLMKAYHKALETYDQGLKVDPNNNDLKEGKMRTMSKVSMGAGGDEDDQARM